MPVNPYEVIQCAWEGLGILWLIGLAFMKPVVRTQNPGIRFLHMGLALLGFALVGAFWIPRTWMAGQFIPASPALQVAGAALTVCGCLFAIWARITLGGNWSGRVTVKLGHELVQKGPYALARHPIYTGLLLALAGTSLALDHWRCLLGLLSIGLALGVKISQEEQRLMMETFPETYPLYRQRVKALIPGIF